MNPFDYVKDASFDKRDLMTGTDNDDLAEKGYNAWLANSAFSYHVDSILMANIMNGCSHIPNKAQYEFYLYGLPKRKRYSAWAKEAKDEDVEAIRQYYRVNKARAEEYLALLSPEQIDGIKKELYTGGT